MASTLPLITRTAKPTRGQPPTARLNLRAIIQAGEHLDQSGKPITAKALARRLGVHRSTVCQWLKADFPDLYDRHYLTFNELWASLKQDSTKPRPVVLDLPKEPEADELI